ncbi:unnamed protein product [Oikopleura dioica]|uniref:Uncharacterized protein n=1 Tax=Oikopleura dioica TaxID=34765 RepID=E4XT43_OIKDI|nr:unnamed protein product [Oikopleura dioica]
MENIEDAKQAATEAFEEAKEAATEAGLAAFEDVKAGLITKVQEAIAKFGDFIKEKIQGLLAQCQGQAPDEEDLMNVGYLAGLQQKYEEAIQAIDEAVNGADDADGFWDMVKDKLEDVLEAGAVPLPDAEDNKKK